MPHIERALETDRIDLPKCGCGRQMPLYRIEPVPDHNKACTLYRCLACQQEIRLTVWAADVVN